MYEEENGKLKITVVEEKVEFFSLDDLKSEKELVEGNKVKVQAMHDAEMTVFDAKLAEIDEKIAKCVELKVPSEKEEAAKLELSSSEAVVDAPIEEVEIKK